MADEFGIEVSGIEEACAMLDRVPKETVKVGFMRGLSAAAVPIVENLEALTPVRKGKLKRALRTDVAIDADGKGGVASINFGNQGHVANFLEYGHRMIGHKPTKKELGEVAPQPFMRPAAADAADDAVEAFAEALTETLVSGTSWASVADAAEGVA